MKTKRTIRPKVSITRQNLYMECRSKANRGNTSLGMVRLSGQGRHLRGVCSMIKKQLDKLMVPRYTGGAMIVAFLFGYVIGAILL